MEITETNKQIMELVHVGTTVTLIELKPILEPIWKLLKLIYKYNIYENTQKTVQ